jgi:peptidoglycan/LPS O-acetylase OafA/YrhL
VIDFWVRRFRRLASLLAGVVLTTLMIAVLVSSPLHWSGHSERQENELRDR